MSRAAAVVRFWMKLPGAPMAWFKSSAALDTAIKEQFEPLVSEAAIGKLKEWEGSWEGMLALILVLDQFPRNLYRGSPAAWEYDTEALRLTERAIDLGYLDQVPGDFERLFMLIPLMHAEDLACQDRFIEVATKYGLPDLVMQSATQHRDEVARFGRFPHRNPVLCRASSPEELAYVAAHGGR